jgi:hypothetical protein
MENTRTVSMEDFQTKQIGFLKAGDVEGLIRECYAANARFHTFDFQANGQDEVREIILLYLGILEGFGPRTITKFETGSDYIWMEMSIQNPNGADIQVYELKFIENDKIALQLFGVKKGEVWPAEFLDQKIKPAQKSEAKQFHERYLRYHQERDADGLADNFFTEDARLATAKVHVEGREAIRSMFAELFGKEADFTPLSVENITSEPDYVWFEATVASNLGERQVYDVMRLRDGQVSLQLVGQLKGIMPTEAANIK